MSHRGAGRLAATDRGSGGLGVGVGEADRPDEEAEGGARVTVSNVLDPFFHGYQSNTSYQVPHGWYLQLCDRYELCLASHLLVSVAGSGTAVRPYSCRTTAVQLYKGLRRSWQIDKGAYTIAAVALCPAVIHTHTLTTDRAAHRRSTPTTARAKAKARTYIPVQP